MTYLKEDLFAECKLLGIKCAIEKTRAVLQANDVLPHKMPESIRHLTLYTRKSTLPAGIEMYSHLTSLVIQTDSLTALPDGLKELQNLQALVIAGSDFTCELDPDSLPVLQGLQMLKINGVLLDSLPNICGMKNLRSLGVSTNLSSLPDGICDLTELTDLFLQKNLLSELPPDLGKLENLHNLHLESNKLTSIPDSLSGHPNLHFVNLNFNKVESLPPLELHSLMYLNLRHNLLTSLDLWGFPSLVELFATGNRLEVLEGIGTCRKLKIIDLSSNKLRQLSSTISSLRRLKELDIRDNLLQSLPVLPRGLEELYCKGNPLRDLNPRNARWFRKHPGSIPDTIV